MNAIFLTVGLLFGVLLYRLGRLEGERGKVVPFRAPRRDRKAEGLLEKIEKYDGRK